MIPALDATSDSYVRSSKRRFIAELPKRRISAPVLCLVLRHAGYETILTDSWFPRRPLRCGERMNNGSLRLTNLLLAVIAIALCASTVDHYRRPKRVEAQDGVYALQFEPGVFNLRNPDVAKSWDVWR
jgi:hypothetical protein